MSYPAPGTTEGAWCHRQRDRRPCIGTMQYGEVVDCYCHTGRPPCGACESNPLRCSVCEAGVDDE